VNASLGYIEHVSLSLYSLLVDFASAFFRFAQVAYKWNRQVGLPQVLFLEYMSNFFMKNEIIFEGIRKCQNILIFAFPIYTAII